MGYKINKGFMWALGGFYNQGPCPDGFHIPTSTEMSAMWTMLQNITGSSSYSNLLTYLRMPLAGMWEDWGGTYGMGSAANYYTCSVSGANAIRFFYNSGGVAPTATINREYAFPIRPFKDTPVVPDSSWTDSYTSGNKKISINTTLGLISMTTDGENRLTIADKNVGATTVYTDGATLSQSNCGVYFQRGNNYGFPFSGTITKSSTKVDASDYGPTNPYESSTFITGGGDWSTVQNDNLWGKDNAGTAIFVEKQFYPGAEPTPTGVEYSYDFTDGTWTDQKLIDDGWLGVNEGYTGVPYDTGYHYGVTMRNGGLDFRNTSSDRDGNFLKKIDVNISDYTTITFKIRGTKNAAWGGLYGKFAVNNNGTEYVICGAQCSYNSSRGALIGPGDTALATDGSMYSVDAILTINIATGARSGTLNGTSYSGTTSIPTIPSGDKYFGVYFSKGLYSTPTGLYELYLKLE